MTLHQSHNCITTEWLQQATTTREEQPETTYKQLSLKMSYYKFLEIKIKYRTYVPQSDRPLQIIISQKHP